MTPQRSRPIPVILLAASAIAAAAWLPARAQETASIERLAQMSLEQLTNVEVSSVSKVAEPLRRAPAAIYVITHDEIVRSGATSIAEALRLAPNLQVTQISSSDYEVAARGFSNAPGEQNFSNKLLVLIDGRSVYSPLFSGVYLDTQDILLKDVDRIEVISGPGATLWGANAMNGVINIITRPAYETEGTLLSAGVGSLERNVAARYGGKINDETAFRVYGKAFQRGSMRLADGTNAHDAWHKAQGGFRLDWARAADSVTLQGDIYRGMENQQDTGEQKIFGANVLTRWRHRSARSTLQVQGYFDQTQRAAPIGGVAVVLHTYDLELQQNLDVGDFQQVVWGAGYRVNSYDIRNSAALLFVPPRRALTLGNVFAQDTLSIGQALKLTLGLKMEDDPYSGWSALPDARIAWQLGQRTFLWAAASRAIRSPTPFDADVEEKLGSQIFLTGNPGFRPERVSAYQVGYRGRPMNPVTLSVSTFYNVYDDLRTVQLGPAPLYLPLQWGNSMRGHTYGIEAWVQWQVTSWWRLSPGFRSVHKDLRLDPDASGLIGTAQSGDDPTNQFSLTSSMNLGPYVTFDAALRHVGALPDPVLPGYYELDARVGWRATRELELALSGSNLLHARHLELSAPPGELISRSVMVTATWRF